MSFRDSLVWTLSPSDLPASHPDWALDVCCCAWLSTVSLGIWTRSSGLCSRHFTSQARRHWCSGTLTHGKPVLFGLWNLSMQWGMGQVCSLTTEVGLTPRRLCFHLWSKEKGLLAWMWWAFCLTLSSLETV